MSDLNPQPLWDWMTERHAVYHRKELHAHRKLELHNGAGFTDDSILQQFRFCNVFRELDRVTVWVRDNIRDPYADNPHLWFMLCIARQINWPETLQELMDRDRKEPGFGLWPVNSYIGSNVGEVLDRRKADGHKVYTGAYMIRAESDRSKAWFGWTKQQYLAQIVLGRVWEARQGFDNLFRQREGLLIMRDPRQPSLQDIHGWLMQFHGWGPFMGYEAVTDLRWTRYLENAPDIYTWANAGPGAFRGLNRLLGREHTAAMTQKQANVLMKELLDRAQEELPGWVRYVDTDGVTHKLEMRDIEHSLCEVDKYLRVKNGEGRPRALYVRGRGW